MAVTFHNVYDTQNLDLFIRKNGAPLEGEIELFKKIEADCREHPLEWHVWHDLTLAIPTEDNSQGQIQIDYLMLCKYGAMVVEVKGGKLGIDGQGRYYFLINGGREYLTRSPFRQAEDYKWALTKNGVFASNYYVDFMAALPFSTLDLTGDTHQYKLWSRANQRTGESIADFCLKVLQEDIDRNCNSEIFQPLTDEQFKFAVAAVEPSLRFEHDFTREDFDQIALNLHISNIDTFKALCKNKRLIIEGGPGCGKTTIAKAFIERNRNKKGLYLCWNNLLAAKFKSEINRLRCDRCEVSSYVSYLMTLQARLYRRELKLEDFSGAQGSNELIGKVSRLLQANAEQNLQYYDYIIIDEAQDVMDKGLIEILRYSTTYNSDGLRYGCYLVLYDTEQGYRNHFRDLDRFADELIMNGAHYVLNGNLRVPNELQINEYAKELSSPKKNWRGVLGKIASASHSYMPVVHHANSADATKAINSTVANLPADEKNDTIILIQKALFDAAAPTIREWLFMAGYAELTEDNIIRRSDLPYFGTMLSFKGLEAKRVILVATDGNGDLDKYELYIGLTRAIENVDIHIID